MRQDWLDRARERFSDFPALLGTVETPGGGEIHQIGTDFVLGVWVDDMDLEHVRVYRLDKGRREASNAAS